VDMHEEEATTTTTTDTPHDQAERALQAMAAAQRANILGAAAMSSIRAMMTGPPPPLRRPKRAATGRMQFDEDDYEAGAFLPVDAVEEGGISSHELRPDETSGGGGGGGGGAGDGSGDGGAGDGVAAAAVAAADPLDSTDAVAILAAMGHVVTATASEAMASPGVQRTDEPAARASLSGWETGVKYVKQCQHAGCKTAARGSTRFCIAHGGGKRCQHEQCAKSAQGSTNFCKAHGGGRRCQQHGCDKSAAGNTLYCGAHGGGRRCQRHECTKSAVGRTQYCKAHGGGKRCVYDGCSKSAESNTTFCNSHGGSKQSPGATSSACTWSMQTPPSMPAPSALGSRSASLGSSSRRKVTLPFPLPVTLPAERPLSLSPQKALPVAAAGGAASRTPQLSVSQSSPELSGKPDCKPDASACWGSPGNSPGATQALCPVGRAYRQGRVSSPPLSGGLALQPLALTLTAISPSSTLSPVTSTAIGPSEEWSYIRAEAIRDAQRALAKAARRAGKSST